MKALSGICFTVLVLSLSGGAIADELEKTEAAVVRGEAWLNDMQEAYRKAPAINEVITVTNEFYKKQNRTGGTIDSKTYRFAFGGQEDLLYEFDGGVVRIHQGSLHAKADSRPGRLLVRPQAGSLMESIRADLGGLPVVFQLLMHEGAPMSDALEAMSQGRIKKLQVVSSGNTSADTQVMQYEVELVGEGATNQMPASMLVTISPLTNLPTEIKVSTQDENTNYVTRFVFKSTIMDKLPQDLVKSATSEQRIVESIGELLAPVAVDDVAPDFKLKSLDGHEVTLSDLKGKVVLLDFWATWCGPCKRGLPMLEELSKWAQSQDGAVEVYAVDIMERMNPKATEKAVSEYWKKNGFTMPALLGTGSQVASDWGIRSIPDTVIIGKDGKVAWRHKGYSPDNLKLWKTAISEALAESK